MIFVTCQNILQVEVRTTRDIVRSFVRTTILVHIDLSVQSLSLNLTLRHNFSHSVVLVLFLLLAAISYSSSFTLQELPLMMRVLLVLREDLLIGHVSQSLLLDDIGAQLIPLAESTALTDHPPLLISLVFLQQFVVLLDNSLQDVLLLCHYWILFIIVCSSLPSPALYSGTIILFSLLLRPFRCILHEC